MQKLDDSLLTWPYVYIDISELTYK
jgi:hypothetical protein